MEGLGCLEIFMSLKGLNFKAEKSFQKFRKDNYDSFSRIFAENEVKPKVPKNHEKEIRFDILTANE